MLMQLKQRLLCEILNALRRTENYLIRATEAMHAAATDDESKAENKYDTRGLEASYLAGAQSKRLAQLQSDIRTLERFKPRIFGADDAISIGAMVELEDGDKRQIVFIVPVAGGLKIELDGQTVSVVTPAAPLAASLLGAFEGDEIQFFVGSKKSEFEVRSVT